MAKYRMSVTYSLTVTADSIEDADRKIVDAIRWLTEDVRFTATMEKCCNHFDIGQGKQTIRVAKLEEVP
jgi:hypothetical protein